MREQYLLQRSIRSIKMHTQRPMTLFTTSAAVDILNFAISFRLTKSSSFPYKFLLKGETLSTESSQNLLFEISIQIREKRLSPRRAPRRSLLPFSPKRTQVRLKSLL